MKYKINEKVYCVNKERRCIECGGIIQIIMEEDKIKYKLEIIGYSGYYSLIVEENLIGKTPEELYQHLRDNIEEYFPLHWRK